MKPLMFICLLLLVATSCRKISISSGWTYSIKGKLLKDCSGTPVANYNLRIWYATAGPLDDPSKVLGTTTTDAQGNFTITGIPVEYISNLNLQHIDDAGGVENWWRDGTIKRPTSDNEIVDIGTIYDEFEIFTVAKFKINAASFSPTDTLYIGDVDGSYDHYYPIPPSVVLSVSRIRDYRGPEPGTPQRYGFIWGKNKQDFDNAMNKAYLGYHLMYSKIGICAQPDTTFFNIP